MPILNYTTQIASEKTVGEIQKMLAAHKAQAILTEYGPEGELSALSFRVRGPFGMMSFRLPANVDKIRRVIDRERKLPERLRTVDQAARVAWRIIKDWLAAQLSLITAEMVTMEQVFLPYAQNERGETVFESIAASKFKGLALPAPQS